MAIWPQQRFGGLKEDLLFINKFPVYHVDGNQQASHRASESTLSLMAEIFANYLQFFMERELILKKVVDYQFSAKSLFHMITASQSFREKIPLEEMKIDSSGLFSFFLQLPLIFSTFDTEIILTAIVIDKRRKYLMLSDFEKLFPPLL